MKIYRRLGPVARSPRSRAVALGNFDGLHLGHQRILGCLAEHARRKGLLSLLLTFAPHPEKVLGRGRMLMIQTLERRLELIRESEIDEVLVIPFNAGFSSLTPVGFMEKILVGALGARAVFVGKNFRFGRGRSGTAKTLTEYGRRTGRFTSCIVPPLERGGRVVSSSSIRELLLKGDVRRAAALLGRPYEIQGVVVRGRAFGRRLGFPTANLETDNEILPVGIFLSRAVIGSRSYPGLTYIGRRPTFTPKAGGIHVETYLLRPSGNLYGRNLSLQLLRKLRDDRKFPDAASLAAQIRRDVLRSGKIFPRST